MNKRKIVVVILAIYLFVLAILTICSSEILKRSLPQVPVMSVQSMYLDGEYYDQVVMQKSVQYGENGASFVWVVEMRQTPLGDRNYIKKIPITIRYQNSEKTFCAIEGAIPEEAKVVCESLELKEGEEIMTTGTGKKWLFFDLNY